MVGTLKINHHGAYHPLSISGDKIQHIVLSLHQGRVHPGFEFREVLFININQSHDAQSAVVSIWVLKHQFNEFFSHYLVKLHTSALLLSNLKRERLGKSVTHVIFRILPSGIYRYMQRFFKRIYEITPVFQSHFDLFDITDAIYPFRVYVLFALEEHIYYGNCFFPLTQNKSFSILIQ